jgi:PAS domain S-box-containing protein
MPGWGSWEAVQPETGYILPKLSEQNYRTLIELCPDALIVHDGETILLANPAMARLVALSSCAEIVGRAILDFVAPSSQAVVEERIRLMHRADPARLIDETWSRCDGTEVEVEVAVAPAPWVGPRAAMVIARDVSERRRLEAEREMLLAEKELLMREVHHRVANSLQIVRGLLNLQARGATCEEVQIQLRAASARISTIGILHSRLQKGNSAVEGEVTTYLEGVIADLRMSLGENYKRPIILEAAEEPMMTLKADLLVALGLIAAEAVTNSIKHGEGEIRVCLIKGDANLHLTVEDEGPGFPPGFDPATDGKGLGMRMIVSLAQARGGKVTVGAPHAGVAAPPSRIAAILPL